MITLFYPVTIQALYWRIKIISITTSNSKFASNKKLRKLKYRENRTVDYQEVKKNTTTEISHVFNLSVITCCYHMIIFLMETNSDVSN